MKPIYPAFVAMIALMLGGCATHVQSNVVNTPNNPPPSEKFSNFNRFVLEPIKMEAPYAGQDSNEVAKARIQEGVDGRINAMIAAWNAAGSSASVQPRTLRIEPEITEIKFVGTAARFWAGAMAGSSIVVLKVRFVEAETGTVVAEPEFYARGGAYAGGWSIGQADRDMLQRIADRFSAYLSANYTYAVGGPTGAGD